MGSRSKNSGSDVNLLDDMNEESSLENVEGIANGK